MEHRPPLLCRWHLMCPLARATCSGAMARRRRAKFSLYPAKRLAPCPSNGRAGAENGPPQARGIFASLWSKGWRHTSATAGQAPKKRKKFSLRSGQKGWRPAPAAAGQAPKWPAAGAKNFRFALAKRLAPQQRPGGPKNDAPQARKIYASPWPKGWRPASATAGRAPAGRAGRPGANLA